MHGVGPCVRRVLFLQEHREKEAEKNPGYVPESMRKDAENSSTEENYVFFPGKAQEDKKTQRIFLLLLLFVEK